jgi:hypothetical protein
LAAKVDNYFEVTKYFKKKIKIKYEHPHIAHIIIGAHRRDVARHVSTNAHTKPTTPPFASG